MWGSTPRSRATCRNPRAEPGRPQVLFASIGALVIDSGGSLPHRAIIAATAGLRLGRWGINQRAAMSIFGSWVVVASTS
jgi:hypothetical protein